VKALSKLYPGHYDPPLYQERDKNEGTHIPDSGYEITALVGTSQLPVNMRK
jgi:hypothetical protein